MNDIEPEQAFFFFLEKGLKIMINTILHITKDIKNTSQI